MHNKEKIQQPQIFDFIISFQASALSYYILFNLKNKFKISLLPQILLILSFIYCHHIFTSSSSSCLPGRSSSPDSRHLVSLGSLLDNQHWHKVAVEHHSNHLNLTVDKNTLWVQIPQRFTHWDHDQVCVRVCGCGTHTNRETPS